MKGTQFLLAALFIVSVLGVIGFGFLHLESSAVQTTASGWKVTSSDTLPNSLETGANGAALAFGILASTCIALYVIIDIVIYKEAKKIS